MKEQKLRNKFRVLYARYKKFPWLYCGLTPYAKKLQKEYDDYCIYLALQHYPKNKEAKNDPIHARNLIEKYIEKFPTDNLNDLYGDITSYYQELAQKYDKRLFEIKDKIEQKLIEYAKQLKPHKGAKKVLYKTISSCNYSSQGYGAMMYAQQRIKLYERKAIVYSLTTEIEQSEVRCSDKWGIQDCDYTLYVFVEDDIDSIILGYMPEMTIKEFVKWCWGNQVNPRVYDPFLPVGLEEKLGLDYFGNDLNVKKEV